VAGLRFWPDGTYILLQFLRFNLYSRESPFMKSVLIQNNADFIIPNLYTGVACKAIHYIHLGADLFNLFQSLTYIAHGSGQQLRTDRKYG
jgi:hypothetical protein